MKQPSADNSFFTEKSSNIIDLLHTMPSSSPFADRVRELRLSPSLESKILRSLAQTNLQRTSSGNTTGEDEEKELASEVLLRRHDFTCRVFENPDFRQAAITIIQNIYLFRQRKIFFGTPEDTATEKERQGALLLFTSPAATTSIPLAKTFQHLILARVWAHIINRSSDQLLKGTAFLELHKTVEQLNTLRNIYILLSTGLVRKLCRRISSVYRQTLTEEDAFQVGSFGIARAAYRYHPSSGQRFSTYAARWIQKEVQRQALEGRLIRISSNLIGKYAEACRSGDPEKQAAVELRLGQATTVSMEEKLQKADFTIRSSSGPLETLETKELTANLHRAIALLPPKSKDLLCRRFGLGLYQGHEQSVLEICREYGVTRSSIYQQEQTALKRLRTLLAEQQPEAEAIT